MKKHRVLLIGSGGRTHAMAMAIRKSAIMNELHCIGSFRNPELLKLCKSYALCELTDIKLIVSFATKIAPSLCIVGPEAPLAAGVVDALKLAGITRIIGPPRQIAQLESDKGWCREFLIKYGLQEFSPKFHVFSDFSDYDRSETASTEESSDSSYTRVGSKQRFHEMSRWEIVKQDVTDVVQSFKGEYVVKPLGLASGKGVKVSGDHLGSVTDCLRYCHSLYTRRVPFLIEEKLYGEEFSLLSLTDGKRTVHFPATKDFKRSEEHDQGPNTGGMGCITDPTVTKHQYEVARSITERIVKCLAFEFPDETESWAGVLFGGFMVTKDQGLKILEYNVRPGDPEMLTVLATTQVDFLNLCLCASTPRIGLSEWDRLLPAKEKAVAIYVVPKAYPYESERYRLRYDEFLRLIRHDQWNANVSLIVGGLAVDSNNVSPIVETTVTGNTWSESSSSASPNLQNETAQEELVQVVFTKQAQNLLQTGLVHTTGSRSLALVAVGERGITSLSSILQRFVNYNLTRIFRWRSDILPNLPDAGVEATPESFDDGEESSDEADPYAVAGVNIEEANKAVAAIQSIVQSTHTDRVVHHPGGFGALFSIGDDHTLVSSTDSVGSKTEFVQKVMGPGSQLGFIGLGKDLVNHCINDILCMGCTEPLFFLDYFATHTLQRDVLKHFVSGVAQSCRQYGCALIGGETAEIKDTYREGAIDLVGCITGRMKPSDVLEPKKNVQSGNVVLALPSVSAHTNGFTLINKMLRENPTLLSTEKRWLLELGAPHRCYLREIQHLRSKGIPINGLVHITGGGLIDNPPRIIREGLKFVFQKATVIDQMPTMFRKLYKQCQFTNLESFLRTFNAGIGFLIVVDASHVDAVTRELPESYIIGTIEVADAGTGAVELK